MTFTSYDFIIFLPAVLLLYWLVRRQGWQNLVLLAASYIFYGWLVPWHVAVLFLSTLIDYFLALGMLRWKAKAGVLIWFGVVSNIGLLAFVKYYFSFNQALANWLNEIGISGDFFLAKVMLPLGLSFYILKKVGYLLDVRSGVLQPSSDFIAFAAYVSFFPQVLSGPIDRPQKLLKQLERPRTWEPAHFYNAWPLLVMGFFKKIVIADTIRVIVDRVFGLSEPNFVLAVPAALGFTLQILADFSAYTDLSRGFALLMGFETTENFRNPYLSLTPTDFWNRWHITLSTWLRDYIFFPLRRSLLRNQDRIPGWLVQSLPPMVTMLVSGIWHGTGWTFLAWGSMYGLLIVIYQTIGLRGEWRPVGAVRLFVTWLVMFILIVFGWFLFRAPSLEWAYHALSTNPFQATIEDQAVALITLSMTIFYAAPMTIKLLLDRYLKHDSYAHALYYAAATLMILVYINSSSPDFIYFQF